MAFVYASTSNYAALHVQKSVDTLVAYLNDTLTYQISIKNTGNIPANNVRITDPIPNGTVLVPGSLTVSVPYTPLPGSAIALTNPIAPDEIVSISFRVSVTAIPNPNPIANVATVDFSYTPNPQLPDIIIAQSVSNTALTAVFRNNYRQEISDLIESIALQQAALAAIANAEGAKIQRLAATPGISTDTLLCLNKSVSDMLEMIALLESIFRQKLSVLSCQLNGDCL